MRYTIQGFNQQRLIDLGLDFIDAGILRWIVASFRMGNMEEQEFDEKNYFQVHYQTVIEELPILHIKSKKAIARRLNKMVNCGLMEKYVNRKEGNYTYFRIVKDVYWSLISGETDEFTCLFKD